MNTSNARHAQGFTLIELVVAMLVAALLVAIAVPSYTSYVLKSHRTEAKSALLDMASLEERFFNTQNIYSGNLADVGYPAGTWPAAGIPVGSGYYQILPPTIVAAAVPTALAPGGTPSTFVLTAVAVGNQTADAACATFTMTSTGVQTATGSDPNPNVDCWH